MRRQWLIGCDLARSNDTTDTTCLTACYKGEDGFFWIKDIIFLDIKNVNYAKIVRTFYQKWHPNFFRRWLFRLFKI